MIKKVIPLSACPRALLRSIDRNVTFLGEKLMRVECLRGADEEGKFRVYRAYFAWEDHMTILTYDAMNDTFAFKYLSLNEISSLLQCILQQDFSQTQDIDRDVTARTN